MFRSVCLSVTVTLMAVFSMVQICATQSNKEGIVAVNETDSLALVTVYNSTRGDHWDDNTNWLSGNPVSSWFGVTVGGERVRKLDLRNNGLSGTIPAAIGNLTALAELYLQNNSLSGSIPPQIGNLKSLTILRLSHTGFSGTLPPEIGNLTALEYLDVWGNQLSGSIPTEIGNLTAMIELDLSNNDFSGSIPPEIGNLRVSYLYLQRNKLSGNIPLEMSNMTELQYLYLWGNQLSGRIPSELGNLTALKQLLLNANRLSGHVPTAITALTNLSGNVTDIGYNMLFSVDPEVTDFLNSKDPNWAETQTVPPTNITVENITVSSADISWDPILYTSDGGGYTIHYGTTSGGPYPNVVGPTADKTVTGLTVSGLMDDTDYYIVVSTSTPPHDYQQNELISDHSEEVFIKTKSICYIRVSSPNDGERWCEGETENITWTSTGSSGNVKIEYSYDEGINWITVIENTPDDGSHPWVIPIIPNPPSTVCLVNICDVPDTDCCDRSDNTFQIGQCGTIEITTESLPDGIKGCSYGDEDLQASGGLLPYSWSIASGSLPEGLQLDPSLGIISGKPTEAGAFNFAVRVTDGKGYTNEKGLFIGIERYTTIKGDVNGDCAINVIDVVILSNCCILNNCPCTGDMRERGDINGPPGIFDGDGFVNVLDSIKIVNIILGNEGRP